MKLYTTLKNSLLKGPYNVYLKAIHEVITGQ